MRRVDDDPKPALADDPNFLASLTDLDQGMSAESKPHATGAPITSAPSAPLSPASSQDRPPRRLLELFPPSATQPSAPFEFPVPLARPAAPARLSRDQATTCETFYGLTESPFGASATDLKFLYQSAAYDRAAQVMLGAIARRDGIVLLTGGTGIGKTMLCRAVVDQLDSRTLISFIDEPFRSAEELLKKVLVDFGVMSAADARAGRLRNANRAELATALRHFIASLAPLQALAVVIIDDAHNLARELLQQITVLVEAEGDERLLQVVLVGQPQLLGTLAKRSLRSLSQRVAVRCTLGPLEPDEIDGYVMHRLNTAGANPRVEFDQQSFRRLYALSRGNPRVINLLCDRALSLGYDLSASVIDQQLIDAAADALDLPLPLTRGSVLRMVGIAVLFALLVIVGAASAALIFRDDVAAILKQLQH